LDTAIVSLWQSPIDRRAKLFFEARQNKLQCREIIHFALQNKQLQCKPTGLDMTAGDRSEAVDQGPTGKSVTFQYICVIDPP
jgi:hypothetical protein